MARLLALVVSSVATSVWLGLAVLGWDGFAPFFADPARVALVAVTYVAVVAAAFTQGNLSSGQQEDRSNRWVLWVFLVIGGLDGWLPAYCDRTGLLTCGGDTVRWLGVAIFAIGCVVRIVPVFVLGRRFSGLVAIQRDHTLVTDGIYRVIRNPSYLGALVMLVGWALAFRSLLGLMLAALIVPVLIGRMNAEEALLAQHFGSEYEAYRARTWRLVPHVY